MIAGAIPPQSRHFRESPAGTVAPFPTASCRQAITHRFRTTCLPLLRGIRGATMTRPTPSATLGMIAPRMSTALGETAQPQAAIVSTGVQTPNHDEPRIAREGAAPESHSLRCHESAVGSCEPTSGKHQTWRGDREAEGA